MQSIGQILQLTNVPGPVEQLPQKNYAAYLTKLYSPRIEQSEEYAAVLVIIKDVANAKQIHPTPDEMQPLAVALLKTGKTIEQIAQMGENVKRSNTYGKIGIDAWLASEPLYTRQEAHQIAESIIRRRRDEWIDMQKGAKWDISDLAETGLQELTGMKWFAKDYYEDRQFILSKIRETLATLFDADGRLKKDAQ